jgi:hypothetical protein
MPAFTVEALVNRARVYISDDHNDSEGFISETAWLAIFNAQYADEYRDWVRTALISPAHTDTAFTAYTTSVEDILAIVGVAEDLGSGRMRVIKPSQSAIGRAPFWGYTEGAPEHWFATGTADELTVTLEPRITGSYVVRTIALPTIPTAFDDELDIPYGVDEHFVLGMARRAKLKDGSASTHLERMFAESEARRNFQAFSRSMNDSPRVRKVTPSAPQGSSFPTDPRLWRYL